MTPRQKQVLDFIVAYQRRNTGISPSYRMICDACGMYLQQVHDTIQSLKVAGYIHTEPGRKRQIHVIYTSDETPSPDFRYRGRSTIRLAEYLAERLGVDESEIRQALLEMPA